MFNRSDQISYDGAISGSGSLTQAGPGTTVLTGTSSYTGGTLISAGTLQIGNGGTSGSIAGDVVNNGALAFNRSDAIIFGGVISGAGTLRQEGSGTLTLTGANTYTGGDDDSPGSRGNGGIAGQHGRHRRVRRDLVRRRLDRGAGQGSRWRPFRARPARHARHLVGWRAELCAGCATRLEAGTTAIPRAPRVSGSPLNDLARVAGDLTLDGTLNITPTSSFATLPGSYRLIEYGGALTDNGLVLGPLPDAFCRHRGADRDPGQVNLIAVRDGLAIQFWDGSDGLGNGQVDGGTGTWNTAATNWTAIDRRDQPAMALGHGHLHGARRPRHAGRGCGGHRAPVRRRRLSHPRGRVMP